MPPSSANYTASVMRTRVSLLERARTGGSELAWEEMLALYDPFVSGILGSMGFIGPDLEDARQQVFLKLWKNLQRYERDANRATFRTWFARLIRNTALNIFRSKKCEPRGPSFNDEESSQEGLVGDDPEIEARIEAEWQEYVVELAFESAKSKFSGHAVEVFQLSLAGVPMEEIATKLRIKINTVYILKHRVKTVLLHEIQRLTEDLEMGVEGEPS